MLEIREIKNNIEQIKSFYKAVFTIEPWNDDWSDDNQLQQYITDLTGNANSLTFGLFRGDEMVGLSMGKIMHWYTGTQYYIDEFCIKTSEQGSGLGTHFLNCVVDCIKDRGIKQIYLQTDRTLPAFKFYQKNGFLLLENQVSMVKDF